MKLTAENYFSPEMQQKYMGVSQYKDFLDCPARAMATIKGEYKPEMTKAQLVGSYVDAYFEGEEAFEKFKSEHPEIFIIKLEENDDTRAKIADVEPDFLTKTGNWKPGCLTKARETHPEFFTLTRELKADYIQAEEIIARLEADPVCSEYLSGQKQVIMTAELFGTLWKIKIDSYFPGDKIVDGKVMRSMERIMGVSFVEYWGYDTQMAVYSEVEFLRNRKKKKERLETYLDVATKEDPIDLDVIHIPAWRRKQCLEEVEKNMPRVLAYKRGELEAPGCGVCPYCRSKKAGRVIEFDEVGFNNKELAAMKGKVF